MDEFWRELADLCLGFLQADDVVLGFVEPIKEAFALGGADSVDVPGDEGNVFGHGGSVKRKAESGKHGKMYACLILVHLLLFVSG